LTWWTDYQARRGQDRKTLYINNSKNLVSTEFENSTSYNSVTINNVSRDVRIVEESSVVSNPNRKRLICYPDETINVGDVVVWENANWICVNNDLTSNISDVGIIIKSNNTLSFYSPSTLTIHSIPCYIDSNVRLYSMGEQSSKYISVPDSSIIVRVPNTSITKEIKRNDIFLLSNIDNYKIVDINSVIEPGLIVFKMEWCAEEQEIPVHNYTISILNGSTAIIAKNNTLQLNTLVTDNSIEVLSPIITYTSSDEDIATVSNDGIISCLAVGSATISVTYKSVSSNIELTVQEEVIPDNYTVNITGVNSIKLNSSITLTATIFNNGIIDGTKSVIWEVFNQDGTDDTYVSIVSETSNSIDLKATNSAYINKYVVVQARKLYDALVCDEHVIQIKSLF
jgi:hypothetical protein